MVKNCERVSIKVLTQSFNMLVYPWIESSALLIHEEINKFICRGTNWSLCDWQSQELRERQRESGSKYEPFCMSLGHTCDRRTYPNCVSNVMDLTIWP